MSTDSQKLPFSDELHHRARRHAPGGVHSNVRLAGPKVFIDYAKGAWLYSVDGQSYVDYLIGQGPNFLGHAPDYVLDAVDQASRRGLLYGGQHELEVQASELLCETLGWPEMVRFGVSGTESVQAALRVARAATGRTKVIRFEGHYHGWLDNVLTAPHDGAWGTASAGQLESHLDDFIVLPWNDEDMVASVFEHRGDTIAAVVMEPIMINTGVIEPNPGYLQSVRELCTSHGAVLIFDEVISGFRLGLGGAAERYGVTPDLATYGKAMAGGWPVSALAGRADMMERIGTGEVNHAGTFNGSVMAMAATAATLKQLRQRPPYADIDSHGTSLMDGLRKLGEAHGVPLRVEGLPAAFHMSFGDADVTDFRSLQRLDLSRYAEFAEELVRHGIWVAPRGIWYVSASHGSVELDAALTRFEKTLTDWG
ncbi:aspartate aminotransferase family protein [Phytoactinopolyspora endophytica]|uniref:aspartate aminotransferase family protein n=1 Tax=Phytoactinopolyspora endophytica TaxID=1642495 RepID=UPI00101E01D2|nr:aspartate aminotransferase family protein [Phytoactinopolyspora endophytica]